MYILPKLDYPYNALEPFIDGLTMEIHHSKHHQTYVDNLNKALQENDALASLSVEELLEDLNKIPQNIRQKVINHGGGHANHSLFFKIMGPAKANEPTGELQEAIKRDFGSFGKFKEQFSQTAVDRFGSGWAWLVIEKNRLHIIDTVNQNSPISDGKKPILALDVWEHAYYLKYQNRRAEYVGNWWHVVNWEEVERFYEKYK